jgi:hypothetical protein
MEPTARDNETIAPRFVTKAEAAKRNNARSEKLSTLADLAEPIKAQVTRGADGLRRAH